MVHSFTARQVKALIEAISEPRFGTYLAARHRNCRLALALYQWNTEVCGAFLAPLQFCEVTVRNGVAGAIERVYGPNWPWQSGFEQSLPNPPVPHTGPRPFNPRKELQRARRGRQTSGQVVADMKFAFWVDMFTSRHDQRLWQPHLRAEFPNLPASLSTKDARQLLRDQLDKVRQFRNRVAHHEPVFRRDLAGEHDRIERLVTFRSQDAALWLKSFEGVSSLLAAYP